MTLEDIERMDCNTLTVKQVAEFLGKDPQTIRDQAEREPKYLGFPICKAGGKSAASPSARAFSARAVSFGETRSSKPQG